MAKQKVAKKAVELLENTVTGDYQPYQSRMWDRPRDLPLFSFFLARTMLWDSTIRLGLRMRSAALQACQFAYKADSTSDQWIPGVEASDEIIGDFVYRQVKRLWENDIDRLLEAQIWGWAAAEVNYKKTRYDRVELDRLVAINPGDARLLMKDGEASGVRFSRLGTVGEYDVAFPKAIFHSFNPPPGDPYGISILMGSISPWADKWLNGGALDVRRLFFVKDAYRGVTLTYPAGRTYSMPDGLTTLSAKELAQQIVEQLKTGGVYTMPYDPDPTSGKNMWELKEASVSANPAHILEYPKDLDTEILRGLEIPDDILTAEQSGAWQGKMVPMQAFYTGLETWLASLVRDVQRQIVEPLVKLNFGEGHWFEITTKPLATQAMEMQKPPQQQGQPGQPQGMANQDDYAEAFRMGLERAVGSGGVRLGLDAEGHEHKGKGKGGGQFTSSGGGSVDMFGEPIKQKHKPAQFEGMKGKQKSLFGTSGEPGQMNLFADDGVPDDMVQKQSSANPKVSAWAAKKFKDPEHAKAFTEWFGDSKVVDENGEPMVVYHGSKNKFDEFTQTGKTDSGWYGAGHYFYPEELWAKGYGPNVTAAYVKLNNPIKMKMSDMQSDKAGSEALKAKLQKAGHDGVMAYDEDGTLADIVVFDNKSIKSATDNSGKFAKDSANIKMSLDDDGWKTTETGTHIFVEDGQVTKGPDGLTGKKREDDSPIGKSRSYSEIVKYQSKKFGIDEDHYSEVADQLWAERTIAHKERENAKQRARGRLKLTAGDIERLDNQGFDHASKNAKLRGLDVIGRELASEYPSLGWGEGYGSGDDIDYGESVWNLIKEGKQDAPSRISPEFHDEIESHLSRELSKIGPKGKQKKDVSFEFGAMAFSLDDSGHEHKGKGPDTHSQ